jgi:hypothetical protein
MEWQIVVVFLIGDYDMKVQAKPLSEITQEATRILFKELGVVNTMRFINQFTTGYGNYTEERDELFGELTLKDILREIEQMRTEED